MGVEKIEEEQTTDGATEDEDGSEEVAVDSETGGRVVGIELMRLIQGLGIFIV